MNDINMIDQKNVPVHEPERQYYFMDACRDILSEKVLRSGEKLTYLTETLGCQMNAKDSEKMNAILEYIGYEPCEKDDIPDFVLFNTCTVRENANQKIYGHLGILKNKKEKKPSMKIALCGCMMQEKDEVELVKSKYRFVDIVFGTHNIYKLAELIYQNLISEKRVIDVLDAPEKTVEDLPQKRKYQFKAGVNIMYGCDNFCTYCIVPYVRGRERSRRPDDIIKEIKQLADDGVTEVMLLGQNVNSYGKKYIDESIPDSERISFAKLLERVEKIDGIKRIRFMTSHPKDLSDELIDVMSNSQKICSHLHLPLQSGSSKILKKMNRSYDKEAYLSLVEKIKNKLPNIALTTDIIVGFPGEDEDDFNDTIDVIKKVRFESAYTFIYSKRTGTPAARIKDDINTKEVIQNRFDRLLEEIRKISSDIAEKKVGKTAELLIEELNPKNPNMVSGRLSDNSIVHIPGDASMIGSYVDVKIKESKGFYYIGDRI
ncbi:MAG: tRNA (N6-isopentenyl adenosine(37)-C2)-methylthiotransferase MiaB [Eubacterium sp.]|nr:tRNA (N6-isopentenyl adenosine(37)-C2)-methylthiotransferase MiaB [Eubacterium sp.]